MRVQNFCAICLLTKLLEGDIIEILLNLTEIEQLNFFRELL